jgi:hypothetical protein
MMNPDIDCRIELTKRLDRNIDPGDDTTTLRQQNSVDAPIPVDVMSPRPTSSAKARRTRSR